MTEPVYTAWSTKEFDVVGKPLTLAMLTEAIDKMKNDHADMLDIRVDSKANIKLFEYRVNSITLLATAGYRRMRGPDGKEWIESNIWKEKRIGVVYGGGNRSKRRMGFRPRWVYGEVYWSKE